MLTLSNILMGVILVSLWLMAAGVLRGCCKALKTPSPGMPGAMLLVLLATAGSLALQFMLGMTLGLPAVNGHLEPQAASNLRIGLTTPIWMLVGASVYRSMLPTTFGKAMSMFIVQAAVVAAILGGLCMLAAVTRAPALMQMRQMLPC
jgi:hypothetical protein